VSLNFLKQCSHLRNSIFGEQNDKWIWANDKPICLAYKNRQEVYKNRQTKQNKSLIRQSMLIKTVTAIGFYPTKMSTSTVQAEKLSLKPITIQRRNGMQPNGWGAVK